MKHYEIIDEPKPGTLNHLIVDPMVILFFSIIVPIIYNPPFAARYWLPFLWLCLNGFLLGSVTLTREVIASLLMLLAMAVVYYSALENAVFLDEAFTFSLIPYVRLLLTGLLFGGIYYVSFLQQGSYVIFKYLQSVKSL